MEYCKSEISFSKNVSFPIIPFTQCIKPMNYEE